MQNNDFVMISKNIVKRRTLLLIGLTFMVIMNLLFFFISYIIKGNEIFFTVIDGIMCFALVVYLIFFIASGKNRMFESLYRIGRVLFALPIGFFLMLTIVYGNQYHLVNYEYLAYMVLSISCSLFLFRFNLKDKNPTKKNVISIVLSSIAMGLVPVFLLIGYFSPAEISVLDFSRNVKYELNDNNTLTITGVYNGLSKRVNVPSEFYTQKVTEIGNFAFSNSMVESIYVSRSIERIGAYAFYDIDDVYLEGNPYLMEDSLYGVSILHLLDKENILNAEGNFFDGKYIDVDRSLVDAYRQNESFKKYNIYPSVESDECFINFDTKGYDYINTVIVKKGEKLKASFLENTKDETYYLRNLTQNYQATMEYYKERYEIDKKVLPYWYDVEGNPYLLGDEIKESLVLSPKVEDVISCNIFYNLGGDKDETVYVSESMKYTLPTITEMPRVGFSDIQYKLGNQVVRTIDYRFKDKSEVQANWIIERPEFLELDGVNISGNKLERVYSPMNVTTLTPKLSHPLDVEYQYVWKLKDENNSTYEDSLDINEVAQSGKYTLSIYALYNEYGVDYKSGEVTFDFDVNIERADPTLTASNIECIYNKEKHPITDAAIEMGESTPISYRYQGNALDGSTYDSTIAPKNAGNYKAIVSIGQTANFKAKEIEVSIEISPRIVKVELYDDMTHTYLGVGSDGIDTRYKNNQLKYIENVVGDEGLISGDDLGVKLSGLVDQSGRYYAGNYIIDCEFKNKNYDIDYTPVIYTISKRDLTITEKNVSTIYGDEFDTLAPELSNIGVQDDKELFVEIFTDVDLTNVAAVDPDTYLYDAGLYYIGYADNDIFSENYNITHNSATLEIAKRTITVTPSGDDLTYNGELQTYHVAFANNLEEDSIDSLISLTNNEFIDAGHYEFVVAINENYKKNYQLSSYDNGFDIKKRNIKLNYTSLDKIYGDSITLEYEVDNTKDTLIEKDKAYITLGLKTKDTNIATIKDSYNYYPANAYYIYLISNDSLNKNYNVEEGSSSVVIGKKDIQFKLNETSLVYNGSTQVIPYTIQGEIDSQKGKVLNISNSSNKNVGNYTITATIKDEFKANYNLLNDSIDYTITKAPLSIYVVGGEIVYGEEFTNSITYSGFKGSDSAIDLTGTLSYSYTYTQYDDAGTYTISASGLISDNYEIEYLGATLNVLKKELVGTIDTLDVTYGEEFNLHTSYQGYVREADKSIVISEAYVIKNKNDETVGGILPAGDYVISSTTGELTNYTIHVALKEVHVLPKELSIVLDSVEIDFGDAYDLNTLLHITGEVVGDPIEIEVSILDYGMDTTALEVGTYTLVLNVNQNNNYVVEDTITATLTVR